MRIFFDFDGTLLDSSDRLYNLFCDLIPECEFSKEQYWEMKRNKINHKMIIEKFFPQYNYAEFEQKWMNLIEKQEYLKYNSLYEFSKEVLGNLYLTNELYLLTARQSKENLLKELEKFDVKKFFKKVLVTENKKTKLELLNEIKLSKDDILVGDTGKDIQTAREAGIKSVAVTYGFMSEEKLKEYKPCLLANSLRPLISMGGIIGK